MQLKYIPFSQKVDSVVTNSVIRASIIAASLALATANMLHLPTTSVEDASSHFNFQVLPGVNQLVSEWNENMVFDARACIDQIKSLWMVRYTAAFPNSRPIYSFDLGFFETMFGVNTFISAEHRKFLDDNKNDILTIAIAASEIILDTKE
jgi:hypothetical protein